jgi:thiol-disulfide isomerase/thioredoxin
MKIIHWFRFLPAVCAAGLLCSVLHADPVTPSSDVNGQPVNFSQFKGKVVVLDFWATWCGPCRSEIPGYVSLQAKYRDKGLVIIGVACNDEAPKVKQFIADNRVNYQIVIGDDSVVRAFGGIEGIPTTFIIDRTGRIRDKKVGAMETADYEKVIQAYLN